MVNQYIQAELCHIFSKLGKEVPMLVVLKLNIKIALWPSMASN